ncbi:MAG TPA: DUF4931 domain-containing protein [Sandaracinaceae bacterium]
MSVNERRVDPFTGRSVIVAPGRRGLGAAKPGGLPEPEGRCPFCPGHEADTEPTLAQWPEAGEWQVRVVANKYPVASQRDGWTSRGWHEVGIDARAHDVDLADLSVEHAAAMLRLYRDRVRALEAREGVRCVVPFRNRGRRAGSSQPHPHSQIVALEHVPAEIALRWERAREHVERHGRPLHETELAREESEGARIVAASAHALVFCPYASSRPYEIRIAPRAPRGGFASATDEELEAIGAHLVDAYARLRAATPITDSNVIVRNPPVFASGPAAAWHLDILPRTGGDAGFELATGEMIVVVPPEEAAARLRAARRA